MQWILRIAQALNWTVVAVFLFFVVTGVLGLGDGGGALAALATVIALTGILWAPFVLTGAIITTVHDVRRVRRGEHSWSMLLMRPGTYVLLFILWVLSAMFV